MSIPEALLQARLIADAGVSAIVGSRVRPLILDEADTLPAVCYQRTNTDFELDSLGEIVTTHATIDVHCLSTTYAGSKTLANAVRSAVAGWKDSDGSYWHIHGESDDSQPVLSGQDVVDAYIVVMQFAVMF